MVELTRPRQGKDPRDHSDKPELSRGCLVDFTWEIIIIGLALSSSDLKQSEGVGTGICVVPIRASIYLGLSAKRNSGVTAPGIPEAG